MKLQSCFGLTTKKHRPSQCAGAFRGVIVTEWPCIQHPPSVFCHTSSASANCPGFRVSRRCCNASKICRSWEQKNLRRFVLDLPFCPQNPWSLPFLQEVKNLLPNSLRTNFEIMSGLFWSAVNTIPSKWWSWTILFLRDFSQKSCYLYPLVI